MLKCSTCWYFKFCTKIAYLATLKTEVGILDIDKLGPVPVDLNKLSDVVENDVVKKGKYDKFVTTVNNIDTSRFFLKPKQCR